MDKIRDNIWIGDEADIFNTTGLNREHINIIFVCAQEIKYNTVGKIVIHCPLYEEYRMKNNIELIKSGLAVLREICRSGEPVLVGCMSGQNRSVCMVSGVIAIIDGTSFDNGLSFVKSKRKIANPTDEMKNGVVEAVRALRGE